MNRTLRGVFLCFWFLGLTSPARGFGDDDLVFDDSPSWGFEDELGGRERKWHLGLGVGGSFLRDYEATFPPLAIFVFDDISGFQFLTTPEQKKKLQPAVAFEASLTRQVFSWLRLGVLGGVTTAHSAKITEEDFGLPSGYFPFRFNFHYNLVTSNVVPIFQIGPEIGEDMWRFRPYVTAGAGWYEINQALLLQVGTQSYQLEGRTDSYLGALAGFGFAAAFLEGGVLGLEARYNRIFTPGDKVETLTPFFHFGYRF